MSWKTELDHGKVEKVNDGYEILKWPELWAFLARVGMQVVADIVSIWLYINIDKAVRVEYTRRVDANTKTVTEHPTDNGFDAWRWSEFEALAQRLGIPYELYTLSISMMFAEGEIPEIVHRYMPAEPILGRDVEVDVPATRAKIDRAYKSDCDFNLG